MLYSINQFSHVEPSWTSVAKSYLVMVYNPLHMSWVSFDSILLSIFGSIFLSYQLIVTMVYLQSEYDALTQSFMC